MCKINQNILFCQIQLGHYNQFMVAIAAGNQNDILFTSPFLVLNQELRNLHFLKKLIFLCDWDTDMLGFVNLVFLANLKIYYTSSPNKILRQGTEA